MRAKQKILKRFDVMPKRATPKTRTHTYTHTAQSQQKDAQDSGISTLITVILSMSTKGAQYNYPNWLLLVLIGMAECSQNH